MVFFEINGVKVLITIFIKVFGTLTERLVHPTALVLQVPRILSLIGGSPENSSPA